MTIQKARSYNQRLTFHPGQYNVIGSANKEVFQNTIRDLKYHADVLDLMNSRGSCFFRCFCDL